MRHDPASRGSSRQRQPFVVCHIGSANRWRLEAERWRLHPWGRVCTAHARGTHSARFPGRIRNHRGRSRGGVNIFLHRRVLQSQNGSCRRLGSSSLALSLAPLINSTARPLSYPRNRLHPFGSDRMSHLLLPRGGGAAPLAAAPPYLRSPKPRSRTSTSLIRIGIILRGHFTENAHPAAPAARNLGSSHGTWDIVPFVTPICEWGCVYCSIFVHFEYCASPLCPFDPPPHPKSRKIAHYPTANSPSPAARRRHCHCTKCARGAQVVPLHQTQKRKRPGKD